MRSGSIASLAVSCLAFFAGTGAAEPEKCAKPYGQCAGTGFEELSCPEGYVCRNINEYYSQCLKMEQVGGELRSMPGLMKRQAATRVTGPTVGKNERKPINWLQTNLPTVFNMFILGLDDMMKVDESSIYSYYEIAGIHGAPFKAYGEDSPPANPGQLGYCTHSSALFVTWHRPYLSLLEQRIHYHAMKVAARFTGSTAAQWQNDATRVRLPYWDWSASDLAGALPSILAQQTVTVTRPGSNGAPQQATINNPLYSYRFTSSRKNSDFNNAQVRNAAQTVRDPPNSQMQSSRNDVVSRATQSSYGARRQNTYNLFSVSRYNQFSNRAFRSGSSPSQFVSVESVHDEIHVLTGGNWGHMSYVEYSAFDPIFFLHHCNIDRLAAIWHAANPGATLEPQQMSPTYARPSFNPSVNDDVNTPLQPFRRSSGQVFTSNDVFSASSIWNLNYAYPEVPARFQGMSSSSLRDFARQQVAALYGPTSGRKVKRADAVVPSYNDTREYLLNIVFNTKELSGAGQVLVYFGDFDDLDATSRRTADNLIGTACSFSSDAHKRDRLIKSTVPLTGALKEAGVSLDPTEAVPYLQKYLDWVVMKGDAEVAPDTVPSLKVIVSSSNIKYNDGIKEYVGEWETHYDVTSQKAGGVETHDEKLVKSKPAPDYANGDGNQSSEGKGPKGGSKGKGKWWRSGRRYGQRDGDDKGDDKKDDDAEGDDE